MTKPENRTSPMVSHDIYCFFVRLGPGRTILRAINRRGNSRLMLFQGAGSDYKSQPSVLFVINFLNVSLRNHKPVDHVPRTLHPLLPSKRSLGTGQSYQHRRCRPSAISVARSSQCSSGLVLDSRPTQGCPADGNQGLQYRRQQRQLIPSQRRRCSHWTENEHSRFDALGQWVSSRQGPFKQCTSDLHDGTCLLEC